VYIPEVEVHPNLTAPCNYIPLAALPAKGAGVCWVALSNFVADGIAILEGGNLDRGRCGRGGKRVSLVRGRAGWGDRNVVVAGRKGVFGIPSCRVGGLSTVLGRRVTVLPWREGEGHVMESHGSRDIESDCEVLAARRCQRSLLTTSNRGCWS
jgi:hypothetical protein